MILAIAPGRLISAACMLYTCTHTHSSFLIAMLGAPPCRYIQGVAGFGSLEPVTVRDAETNTPAIRGENHSYPHAYLSRFPSLQYSLPAPYNRICENILTLLFRSIWCESRSTALLQCTTLIQTKPVQSKFLQILHTMTSILPTNEILDAGSSPGTAIRFSSVFFFVFFAYFFHLILLFFRPGFFFSSVGMQLRLFLM